IALKSGSTNANKPEFSLTGASGVVKVTLKRKVTKAVLTNAALASGLFDEAILTIGGVSTNPPAKNATGYQLPRPTLAVQLPTAQTDVLGARTETFDIRNTGYGKVKDVYFSIAYDHRDVVGGSVSHNGTLLTPVGTVPVGLPNAGKPIYKIPNANLANNGVVTITEKYTVNKCTAGRQNTYYAYWGSGIANSNDIFETSSNTRNISVSTGIPIIRHSDNSAFNYFKWQDGFCGNILGTYYVRFNNETADPKGTAYNVEVKLFDGDPTIGFSFFEPINIRLVATDGTEIPIAATGTGDTRFINFTNLAAVSNASLGTKNVGFTDEDGDGFKDDLKKGAYFQIAFDLKRKQSFQCLQPGKGPKNYFSLQPRAYVLYDNVCRGGRDSSDLRLIDYGTMRIYFNGVNDASKLPAQLVQNVPSAGYIAPGMNWPSLGIHQRTKNTTLADNEHQFKYVITTPAGVKLQNVKLYRRTNVFGASPTTPVNQPDIEAGTTVTITTTNTPAYRDLTSGYLSFDALLQSCNGAAAPITYSVYLMVKNGNGTYCDIPLVCNQVTNIPTICSTPCAIQGPRMLSTKVERADNSYGWKDHTMAARQTRANVSSIERMRALYLDDIEFISEGQQHTGKSATNLFYYAKVENTAKLEPKKITLKVNGGAEQTFTATPNNPMRGTDAAGKNYFRWNLTSLLPTGTLPAGATFNAVATYQVKNNNPTNSNERTMDIQSGIESFFYTLDNPATDVAISTEGYHTAEKHCGANLTPIFYIAETQSVLATNEYKEFSGCNIVELGGNLIYAARRFKSGGTYFSQEFRPARLTKKITIKMPSAYRINNIKYTYTYKIAEAAKEATVDMSRLTVVDDGTWKTYTYINPPKGTTGHLPPGMITVVNDYNEYLKVFIQPSCKAKTVDGNKTYWDQGLDAKAMNEKISSNIEYEDYYYHYAETGNSLIATDYLNDRPILFAESKKPEITIEAISQLTVKANKRVMEATFKLKNIKEYDAPFGWISIPDVTGIEVLSLEESGHTYTAQNSISGEKMFFLSDKGNDGKILKNSERQFKLKYKITNCAAALQLKVYAGWNCNENPTSGYRNTCSDKFITYNIAIALSKKEIKADPTNPGENQPNKRGEIPMCAPTTYKYEINSADEGDIYNAKLVVTQGNGITISNVKVEYPLGGTVYTVGTGAGKIPHTQSGNRHTYDISNILPEGSLPGSLNEPNNANKRKFKLTFDVTPDCNFSAGSSFDIDVEGTNLCDSPAAGDKTRAIIAGIQGVNISDYNIKLDPLTYVSGNGTLCGGGVIYKTRVEVNSGNSTFQVGSNARLKFTIPEGYELAPSYARYYGRTPYGPGALWANPVRKQAEERILASGSELVMEIPAGMKNGQFFEFGIHIIQKAAALLDCDNPKQLKVYATDTKTGVMCGGTACPPVTVTTSPKEETVNIKNERPKLSFSHTQVNATAVAKNGKEELTIKYKIKNASGAAALTNTQPLKIDLYKDVNNSGGLDSGDVKLSSTPYTLNINLPANTESAEQTITAEVPQDAVCRLLLAINNQDNVCLCQDVVATLNAPTELTGLVDNLTICESETKQIAYSAAGASYEAYTWSGKTTDDNITYLSAANVKEPNFHYTGTKLTATKTFTYKLKVKRTNGCEATQEVKITVQPAPSISTQPVVPTTPYCMGGAATPLTVIATSNGVAGTLTYEWYENTTNNYTGATLKNTGQNFTPPTNVAGTKYYFVKVKNSGCGETLSNIVMVKTNATPAQPTVTQDQAAGCGTVS
ncbi:immunoglobulin domain-containing protein, partial [Capnocytophaga gingivalis]